MSNIITLTICFLLCSSKMKATGEINLCDIAMNTDSGNDITFKKNLLTRITFVRFGSVVPRPVNGKDVNHKKLEEMINKWLFFYTNLYRKQNGRDTLTQSSCLREAACNHALYLGDVSLQQKRFVLMHEEDSNSVWFNGYSPSIRAAKAGCNLLCGENALCTGLPIFVVADLKDRRRLDHMGEEIAKRMVYNIWQHSKGHRENILDTHYKHLGTAVSVIDANFTDCNNGDKESFIYLVAFAIQVFGRGE